MQSKDDMGVLAWIRLNYNEFHDSILKVADYFLHQDAHTFPNISIISLADEIGVSEATIIRFCKKLGFSGYSEFKLRLASELGSGAPAPAYDPADIPISPDDSIDRVPEKIVGGTINGLHDMLQTLQPEMLESAVHTLTHARQVVLFGVANSAVVCRDLQCKLMRLGIVCQTYDDSHQQLVAALSLTPKDAAVVISHSGLTVDTVDAARCAKKRGATVICISNCLNTPLIDTSDIKLLTGGHEASFTSETTSSRISQLAIIDMLYVGVILTDYEKYTAKLSEMNQAMEQKAYKMK